MSKECACKGCKERHMNCHSECEAYMHWSKQIAEEREAIRKKKELVGQLNATVKEGRKRMRTRRAKKYVY